MEIEIEEDVDRGGIDVPILETFGMTQWDIDDWGNFWDELVENMWEDYRSQH